MDNKLFVFWATSVISGVTFQPFASLPVHIVPAILRSGMDRFESEALHTPLTTVDYM